MSPLEFRRGVGIAERRLSHKRLQFNAGVHVGGSSDTLAVHHKQHKNRKATLHVAGLRPEYAQSRMHGGDQMDGREPLLWGVGNWGVQSMPFALEVSQRFPEALRIASGPTTKF